MQDGFSSVRSKHPVYSCKKQVSLTCLIFFLMLSPGLSAGLSAQSMSVKELMDKTGASLYWDPWRKAGQMIHGSNVLVFRVGEPWMILNGKEFVVTGTVIQESGVLVFSSQASSKILEIFGLNTSSETNYDLNAILIDPGHGGRDSGARRSWEVDGVPHVLMEKDVVLDIGLRLAGKLRNQFPDKRIMLTRSTDAYPALEERVNMANSIKLKPRQGMIYISLHANASLNTKAEGYEVWYLPEDYRRNLAKSENVISDPVIAPIVNTLWEEEFTKESVRLADMVLAGIASNLDPGVSNRGRREESWFVVRNAKMASILVEIGFITNQAEAKRLRSPKYLSRIAEGIYDGIIGFIDYFENREFLF